MVKSKYDQLPCEAQITVNEQLFRYGLNTYLSLIGVSAVSDGMTDSDAFDVDVPLVGACTVDGVDIEEVNFGKLSGNGRKIKVSLGFFPANTGLMLYFDVVLTGQQMVVEQLLNEL
ncbi:MAG: hypothetical protein ABI716_03405 [Candidatus Saccharibacteria bacterium]